VVASLVVHLLRWQVALAVPERDAPWGGVAMVASLPLDAAAAVLTAGITYAAEADAAKQEFNADMSACSQIP
jgi:hypothetical protein